MSVLLAPAQVCRTQPVFSYSDVSSTCAYQPDAKRRPRPVRTPARQRRRRASKPRNSEWTRSRSANSSRYMSSTADGARLAGGQIRKEESQAGSSGSAIGAPHSIHLRLRQSNPNAIVGPAVLPPRLYRPSYTQDNGPCHRAIVRVVKSTHDADYPPHDQSSNRPVSGGLLAFGLGTDSNMRGPPALPPLTLPATRYNVNASSGCHSMRLGIRSLPGVRCGEAFCSLTRRDAAWSEDSDPAGTSSRSRA